MNIDAKHSKCWECNALHMANIDIFLDHKKCFLYLCEDVNKTTL